MLARKPFRAAPWRLMSFAQEIAHSIIDMFVNGPIRRCESAMGEVSSPTAKRRFRRVRTFGHALLLPGVSRSLTFVLIRCTLFLDGLAPRYQRPPVGKWRGPSV